MTSEFEKLLAKIAELKQELANLVPENVRARALEIVEEIEGLSAQAEEEAR